MRGPRFAQPVRNQKSLSVFAAVLLVSVLFVVPHPGAPVPVQASNHGAAEDDAVEMEENTELVVPVLENDLASAMPSIEYGGTNEAHDASGPYLVSVSGIDFYAFNRLQNGIGASTTHAGFDSLAGEPGDALSFTWDDLELDSVNHNAPSVYEVFGELDGNVGPFVWTLNGATAAEGTFETINVAIDNSGGATQGLATAYGQATFTGPAGHPFYEELKARSCGTGTMWFEADTFVPTVFSDPETYETTGTAYPVGFTVVTVEGARHGDVTIASDGQTVTYAPLDGFNGIDSFDYTIEDCDGNPSTATVTVTVSGENDPPTIDLSHTTSGLFVTAQADVADPECAIGGVSFTFGDGTGAGGGGGPPSQQPPCALTSFAGKTYAAPGTYTLCATVADQNGVEATACNEVTVEEVTDLPPVASFTATPAQVLTLEPVTFTDTSTDDGQILGRGWTFGDGQSGSDAQLTHAYADDGTFNVCLVVTDNAAQEDIACQDITVLNRPPTISFTHDPIVPHQGQNVLFSASGDDADGFIVDWDWTFGDGVTGSGPDLMHAYADDGVYSACVVVTDDDGASATACSDVTVTNLAPIAAFDWFPVQPTNMDNVRFDSLSYDPDGSLVDAAWDFGDGATAAGDFVYHRFEAGQHEVTLTVEDDDGATGTISYVIDVLPVIMKGQAIGVQGLAPDGEAIADTGAVVAYGPLVVTEDGAVAEAGIVSVSGAHSFVSTELGTVQSDASVDVVEVETPAGILTVRNVQAHAALWCGGLPQTEARSGGVYLGTMQIVAPQDFEPGTEFAAPGGVTLRFHETASEPGSDSITGLVVVMPDGQEFRFATATAGLENCPVGGSGGGGPP